MIEEAIHEILADAGNPDAVALSALLPHARIVTGSERGRDLPYATLNLEGNLPEYRANSGDMRQCSVRFQLWHDNHEAGCEIRDALEDLFENKSFDTSTAKIVCSRHQNTFVLEEEDGVWQFNIQFDIKATRV